MVQYVWLVLLLPLLGFLVTGIWRNRLSKTAIAMTGCGTVLGSFLVSCVLFFQALAPGFRSTQVHLFNFISVGTLQIPFDFQVDQLTLVFLLIITGVGFLIHLYSASYMRTDAGYGRYFSYLNLFVFSMLLLVLGANYVILFIGWEGVGLCSYLLIGFWYDRNDFNQAAKKAFIMNRIGDLGFLIGLFLMISRFSSVSFGEVFAQASALGTHSGVLVAITLLLLVGAVGKSAQIPLYTWLPDAMAGPTPVSALIHAATMVTAGIYMIARSHVLYSLAPATLNVVALIGLATAILAASIALKQYDIKKVLAYSTVSQLGFMFLGLGVGAYGAAVFHVMTHAFFKALLFLGAGSVIHALGGEQDIRRMGGLRRKLPVTYWTFLVACLAISGIPPFSGFFSKDAILAAAYREQPLLYYVGLAGALMTAFYMFRLFFITFHGDFRGTEESARHLHESPPAMTIPLVLLALLSFLGGWVGIPSSLGGKDLLGNFLAPVFRGGPAIPMPVAGGNTDLVLMIVAAALSIAVVFWTRSLYRQYKAETTPGRGLVRWLEHKWYVDELYDFLFTRPLPRLSNWLERHVESPVIDGAVNGMGRMVQWGSRKIRLIQSGQVGLYIFGMVAGAIILFLIAFFLI